MFDQFEQNQGEPWSIAKEIDYLAQLAGVHCWQLKPIILAASLPDSTASQPSTVLSYDVPFNFTLITTRVSFRSIPPVADPDLTVMDWRSDEVDASGSAKAHWEVNGVPFTNVDAAYSPILNREHILAFAGGERASLVIEREAVAVPVSERYVIAVSGYLAPPKAYDCLSSIISAIDTPPLPPAPPGPAALALGTSLKVLDISDPSAPTLASTVATASVSANNCFTMDAFHRAYVFNQKTPDTDSRLQIFNCTNRSGPIELASVFAATANDGYKASVVGSLLWVVTDDPSATSAPNTLRVFDVSDPSSPTLLATYDLALGFAIEQDRPVSAIAEGVFVYVTSNGAVADRFGVYDGTNPLAVLQASVTDLVGTGQAVLALEFPFAYVYHGPPVSTLLIFDVTSPAAPSLVGSVGGFGNAIFMTNRPDNGFLYFVAFSPADRGIRICDVSNPAAPVIVGSPLPTGTVNRNLACAAKNGQLVLFCLETAIGPMKAQVYDASAGDGTLTFLGEVAYNATVVSPSSPYID